jgi:lysyl-tRNA synthetase, class II
VINKHYGIDVYNTTIEEVAAKLKEHGLEVEKTDSIPRSIDKLWKNIRKDVAGPVWLVNTPKFISPLSKTNPDNPQTVERFQPITDNAYMSCGSGKDS